MVVLKSKKHVFWEALFLVVIVFVAGIMGGLWIEGNRVSDMNTYFLESEATLLDGLALSDLISTGDYSCEILKKSNVDLANKIYGEARILENLEEAGLLTENMGSMHTKYDTLRTFLWKNNFDILDKCGDYHLVVYLYEYESADLGKKATQSVWSKILMDLKNEYGENVVLIPIASDMGVVSLDLITSDLGVQKYPAVVIDNKFIVYDLESVDELKGYFE